MIEIANKTKQDIDEAFIEKAVRFFLDCYRIKKDVSIAIIGDSEMKRLNKEYRGKDKTTDVLSFADEDAGFLGEIVLSMSQLKRQAPVYSRSLEEELAFILFHGLLHLVGYEDETDEGIEKMEKEGARLIKIFNDQYSIFI